jgi:glycosyltransferase involved in cell wall biosynthesis/peptidoglycan/xylan/chitin deacetylase (PgdA/CDA1 family)
MIVHLFNSSSVSGPERLVLPALARVKENVVVVNLREERIKRLREIDPLQEYARSLKLDYCDVRVYGHWDYVAVRDLRILLDRLDPELVHAHDVKASAYLLSARTPHSRFRTVSTHHGIHGRPDLKTRFYEWFYRRQMLPRFDRVFCVSTPDYETLQRSGIDASRLRLHLNGVDSRRVDFSQRVDEARRIRARWLPKEPRRNDLFLFGVVGRLSREKDHDRLFRILSHLQGMPTEQDWRCLIFGSGPLDRELRKQVHQLKIDKRVVWMGYRNAVGEELAGLDLLLSLSKAEGLPINLIEAGWAGTPVMSTQVGGVMDLIPSEAYGNWIAGDEPSRKTASRLHACLSAEGQSKLSDQAFHFQRRITSEFTQARWVDRMKELYSELGVDLMTSAVRPWGWHRPTEPEGFGERLQRTLLTRLLLYPNRRLQDIRGWNRDGFRILMYHHFPSSVPDIQEALSRQCQHIRKYYHVVSMNDIAKSLHDGTRLPPNALAITIDDGYRDFLCNGFPVFRSHRLPVTMFLATEFIDQGGWLWWDKVSYLLESTRKTSLELPIFPGQSPLRFELNTIEQRRDAVGTITEALKEVTDSQRVRVLKLLPDLLEVRAPEKAPPALAPLEWSEIRYLAENGIEFGAHSHTHPILSRLETKELGWEIGYSKGRIEKELQRPVRHFGYPNGRWNDVNEAAFKVLEDYDFLTATTTERGVNFRGAHPFWLRRVGVEPTMSKFNFEVLLAGLGGSRTSQRPRPGPSSIPEQVRFVPPVVLHADART